MERRDFLKSAGVAAAVGAVSGTRHPSPAKRCANRVACLSVRAAAQYFVHSRG